MADNYRDKVVYPRKPDSMIGSEDDGDGESLGFTLQIKKGSENSRMPTIPDAYKPRYKEYR